MVSDLKTFAYKGCKIASQKKLVFWRFLPYYQDFFGIGATIHIGREIFCLMYAGFVKPPDGQYHNSNKSLWIYTNS